MTDYKDATTRSDPGDALGVGTVNEPTPFVSASVAPSLSIAQPSSTASPDGECVHCARTSSQALTPGSARAGEAAGAAVYLIGKPQSSVTPSVSEGDSGPSARNVVVGGRAKPAGCQCGPACGCHEPAPRCLRTPTVPAVPPPAELHLVARANGLPSKGARVQVDLPKGVWTHDSPRAPSYVPDGAGGGTLIDAVGPADPGIYLPLRPLAPSYGPEPSSRHDIPIPTGPDGPIPVGTPGDDCHTWPPEVRWLCERDRLEEARHVCRTRGRAEVFVPFPPRAVGSFGNPDDAAEDEASTYVKQDMSILVDALGFFQALRVPPMFVLPYHHPDVKVVSGYMRSAEPDAGQHHALDLARPREAADSDILLGKSFPVFAVADGLVTEVTFSSRVGNIVTIEHVGLDGRRFRSRYMHLRNGTQRDLNNMQRVANPLVDCNTWRSTRYTCEEAQQRQLWALEYTLHALAVLNGRTSPLYEDADHVYRFWGRPEHRIQVVEGETVRRGQLIGWAGTTGWLGGGKTEPARAADGRTLPVDGTHLHFEMAMEWRVRFSNRGTAVNRFVYVDPFGLYSWVSQRGRFDWDGPLAREGYNSQLVHFPHAAAQRQEREQDNRFRMDLTGFAQHASWFRAATFRPCVVEYCRDSWDLPVVGVDSFGGRPWVSEHIVSSDVPGHGPVGEGMLGPTRMTDGGLDSNRACVYLRAHREGGAPAVAFYEASGFDANGLSSSAFVGDSPPFPTDTVTSVDVARTFGLDVERWIVVAAVGAPGRQMMYVSERQFGHRGEWSVPRLVVPRPDVLPARRRADVAGHYVWQDFGSVAVAYDSFSRRTVLVWTTRDGEVNMATRRDDEELWVPIVNFDEDGARLMEGSSLRLGVSASGADVACSQYGADDGNCLLVYVGNDGRHRRMRFRVNDDGTIARHSPPFARVDGMPRGSQPVVVQADNDRVLPRPVGARYVEHGSSVTANPMGVNPQFVFSRADENGVTYLALMDSGSIDYRAGVSYTPRRGDGVQMGRVGLGSYCRQAGDPDRALESVLVLSIVD